MGSKGLRLMVTLQLCNLNQDRVLDRNSSEEPLHIKRHCDLVVLNDLTIDIEDEMHRGYSMPPPGYVDILSLSGQLDISRVSVANA